MNEGTKTGQNGTEWNKISVFSRQDEFYTVSVKSHLTNGIDLFSMEQHALKNVNNCLNTNIYSYLETSGGQSSNPYFNIVYFLNTRAD